MMPFIKEQLTNRISSIIFVLIAIQVAQTLSAFTDVPRKLTKIFRKICFCLFFIAPPARPDQFHSREELKRYLQLVCLNFNI